MPPGPFRGVPAGGGGEGGGFAEQGLRSVSFTPPALASLLPLSRDCNRDLGRRATAPSRCRWLAPKPAENAHNPRLTDPHKASRDSRPQAVPASADSWLVGQERSGGRHLSSSEEADRLYVLERLCVFKRNASLSSLHSHVLLSSSDPQTTCSLLWESEGNRMLPAPYFLQVVHSALMKKSLTASRSDRAGAGGRALAWGLRTCLLTLY